MNLALGQPAYQSSTSIDRVASRAVDGSRANNMFTESCTLNGVNEPDPWWAVDLGNPANISRVTIFNRGDCCGKSLGVFLQQTFTDFSVYTCGNCIMALLSFIARILQEALLKYILNKYL